MHVRAHVSTQCQSNTEGATPISKVLPTQRDFITTMNALEIPGASGPSNLRFQSRNLGHKASEESQQAN